MQILNILVQSLIIGSLVGFTVCIGVSRMFNAPTDQALGAFRTLGEISASEGNPTAHFSFGLRSFLNSWASTIAAGSLTQDITHRVIPNWAAAILMYKNHDEKVIHDPKKMGIVGAVVGAIVVTFLNLTSFSLPQSLQITAVKVLVPAASLLVNTVMPVIFWLAAIDAGHRTGILGTFLGGLAQIIMGNAVPGLVLGILIGKGVEESGWNKITKAILAVTILLFTLSAFFRKTDLVLLKQLNMAVPDWLKYAHGIQ